MNCFIFSYTPRYYFWHPWLWVADVFRGIKNMIYRARYGFCYTDAWNMDTWMLFILPKMLRHVAKYGIGYPGNDEFPTIEAWHKWLNDTAFKLEFLQEENWENRFGMKEQERRQQLVEEVMTDVGKHFFMLWD